ncbi:YitT family protein, partial [Vagococcus penaei]
FGGLFIGTGVGLVYLGNGSTGGTSLLALLIQKFVDLRLGILLGICDGLVILSALFVFDIQTVLFALITLYLTSRMIDTVKVGPDFSKNLFVISTKYEAIREKLVTDLNCGVTYIPIEGGLNLDKSKMIMTVIREENFVDIKQAILDIDPEAFITIHSASEVVGRGFTLKKN